MLERLRLRLGFRDANRGDFGVNECRPGQLGIIHLPAAAEHRVLKCDLGLAFHHVGVLVAKQNIADGVDAHRVRLERVVNLDAVLRVGVHPDRLEIQILQIGQPTARAEDLRRWHASATSPVAMSL